MPDITLKIKDLKSEEDAERLERVLSRLGSVDLANVDGEKGLAAVSYKGTSKGAEAELSEIESAIKEAGFEFETTPGASRLEE